MKSIQTVKDFLSILFLSDLKGEICSFKGQVKPCYYEAKSRYLNFMFLEKNRNILKFLYLEKE